MWLWAGLIIPVLILAFILNDARAVNLRGYLPGDWVSYTNTRFVRTVGVGFYNVYFGTTQGILVYDMTMRKWKDPITESDGLPDDNIRMMAVNPDGSAIWVSTPDGSYKYEKAFEEWYREDFFPLEFVQNDPSLIDNFQSYIPPMGYHAFAPNIIQDENLRDFPVVAAAEGPGGDIWLGTWGLGPGKIEQYGIDLELLNFGLYNSDVRTIYKNGDIFYFGGREEYEAENALTVWDRESGKWEYHEARYTDRFISDEINDIIGVDDEVFLATDFGLVRLNPETGSFRSYTSPGIFRTNLLLSLENHKEDLFIGTDQGMYRMNLEKDSLYYMGGRLIENSAVFDIEFYKGDLWVGTEYGALRYDFQTNRFYRYSTVGGVLLGATLDVEPDPNDGLWFATDDAIVWMNDRWQEQERFYVEAELNGYHPNKLLVMERYLWVATDYGVYRWDRQKKYWKHYIREDGLIDDMVFDIVDDGDHIWFATAGGATRFYWNNPLRGEDF